MSPFLEWFCGSGLDHTNSSRISEDTCLINSIAVLPHIIFIFISGLTLLCCFYSTYRNFTCIYLQKFPAHNFRWILLLLFILLSACSIGEGVLTDQTYRNISSTQPQLYLPAVLALLGAIVSLVYYHHCECWRAVRLTNVLLAYWILGFITEILKVHDYHVTDEADINVARYNIAVINILVYFMLIVLEVYVQCCSKKISFSEVLEPDDMKFYQRYCNFLSFGLFYWIRWLLLLGYRRPLEMKDLGSLPTMHQGKYNYQKLRKVFRKEMQRAARKNEQPSLWKVYLNTFPRQLSETFLTRFLADFIMYVLPVCLYAITRQIMKLERGEIEEIPSHYITVSELFSNVYVLCLFFCLSPFVNAYLQQIHYYGTACFGVQLRSAIQALVYEKSLRIYNLSGGSLTVGQITNHMSTDAMNLYYFSEKMHLCWSIPLEIIVVLAILYSYVGVSAFLGFLSVILLIPLQAVIIGKSSKHQEQALKCSDIRLKRSNEMLQGMKLLKLYGWEDEFRNRIEDARATEMKSIFNFNFQYGNIVSLCFMLPTIISLVMYGTYPYLTGNNLTPDLTFAVFTLINLLIDPLYQLPVVLSNLVNAVVATRRLGKFFTHSEIDTDRSKFKGEDETVPDVAFQSDRYKSVNFAADRHDHGSSRAAEQNMQLLEASARDGMENTLLETSDQTAIKITQGNFTWDSESTTPVIRNINVDIEVGTLVMVVGEVGCGKSSLLSAIIGEMTTLSGYVDVKNQRNKVAYTAQTAWIINASLKENILFGRPYDRVRYKEVIDACALQLDIDILPAGDETEIGEKGINLSGGQKQRVSVARAMYSDKELVLLDDPLSALDVHVGGHFFKEGIMGMLRKSKKTVVLVTHQLQYLQQADKVLVMKDGTIVHDGTFDDISNVDPTLFANWKQSVVEASETEATSGSESDVMEERKALKRQVRLKVLGGGEKKGKLDSQPLLTGGELMQAEELERGSVSFQVYIYFMKSMGWPIILAFVCSRVAQEIANIGRCFWLAFWAEQGVSSSVNATANFTNEVDNLYYLANYGWISLALAVTTGLMAFTAVMALYLAAKNIHLAMIRNVFGSPLRFFDTTPTGRTLNRMSSDTQIIDIKLLVTLVTFLYFAVSLPFTLIAITIVLPIFLAEVIPVFIAYFILQRYFIASSRELQRLYSITKSPVFAHYSETLGGLPTIRAYGVQERLFNELLKRIDTNNTAFLYLQACYGWIGNSVNFLAVSIIAMASITAIILAETSQLSSSYVGLVLSFSFTIPYFLWAIVRFSADTEIQMNAVERVQHYTQLPNETTEGREPPSSWPHRGEIKIEDIHVRYASDLPSILKSVNLFIKPGEKVGICGRTGSGKSSLTLSLFRVIDNYKGQIIIDGEDIANLPLRTLRRRLSIIPQEPILFTGSIRGNIDPEGTKSDAELWDALETAQMKHVVSELESGLDYEVSEGGENFSVGQRQLFCLARAFLRNSRILIMDEATASIDFDTEKILQEVVSSAFLDKTVITIAHRVSTILKSDTIVVLNEGEIVEHDTPDNLLANKSSIFASLVQANK